MKRSCGVQSKKNGIPQDAVWVREQRLFFHCAQGFLDLAFELVIGGMTVPEQFPIHADAMAALQAAEKTAAYEIFALDKDALRILDMNAKIAAKEEVPAEEAKGIEECNLWRLLVGLNACMLDPQLCAASRNHSKDMAGKGFFAHESPVPSKTSSWNRVNNFYTIASGENIFAVSLSSYPANSGWFYSPGHHKNMFSPGQNRIGLGQHCSHWNQMFGR